jgi:cytochrome P450
LRGAAQFLAAAAGGGILQFFEELSARYGPVSSFPLGPQRIVFVDDPVLVETILVTRQHEFVRDTGATLLRELVGDGLLTSEDPTHLARRRLMQPAFHRARVAAYADAVVEESLRVAAAWPDGAIDMGAEMARLTLAAVGRALFGGDLRDEARAISGVLGGVVRRGASLGALLAFGAPLLGPLHRLFPERASFLFPRERAELERIVAPLIARRREGGERDDLLSMLLFARDEGGAGLDDAAVRNEVAMLVLAGHETTANALTWTWYLLAEHPEIERRLHEELDAVLGGRTPQFTDVANLRYTAAIFDETLRLYPPASAFARRPLRSLELGGYAIPRMASVFVSPYVAQRNPRYFDDPLAFDPGRWAGPPPAKFAYFPFGGGSKMCIGEPFARMEAVLAIAAIASRYRLRRTGTGPVKPAAQALLRPERPLEFRAEPR